MKSETYKITLIIEAAIAVLIAFCLAFFGPLSLNDMTYGEFDMQVFTIFGNRICNRVIALKISILFRGVIRIIVYINRSWLLCNLSRKRA